MYFAEKVLGLDLWERQRAVLHALDTNRRVSVRSCHNVGKTKVSASAALHFLSTNKDSKVITSAPTHRQVEQLLWREMRDQYNKARYPLGGTMLTTRWEISDEWVALGISTNDPDKISGFHSRKLLFIFDEAPGIEERIFEAVEGSLSNEGTQLLLIGNPSALSGTFYQSQRDKAYARIHISALDSPNFAAFGITLDDLRTGAWRRKVNRPYPRPYLISPEWAAERLKRWGEDSPMFRVRVLGEFPDQASDTLIPLRAVERAVGVKVPEKPRDKVRVGVDVARFGTAKTVFVARKGGNVLEVEKHALKDVAQTAGLLVAFMKRYGLPVTAVDEVGIGAGVVDMLRADGHKNVVGVNVGTAAVEGTDRHANLRSELFWRLREDFINGEIGIPDDDDLIGQLANIKYQYNRKGQVKVEGKDEMVKRGVESPDVADAMALAFAPLSAGGFVPSSKTDQAGTARPTTAGWLRQRD